MLLYFKWFVTKDKVHRHFVDIQGYTSQLIMNPQFFAQ